MTNSIFVTGTDTNVGKTVIIGCLAHALKMFGKRVCIYKPVQCGNLLKGALKSKDLHLAGKISGIGNDSLANDYCFELATSPHLAAEREKIKIDTGKIRRHFEKLKKGFDFVLVEGAGGLMVPITREYTVLDLMESFASPALVVARASLGTINHTTLTIKALQQRGIRIKGVILNCFSGGLIEDDNEKIISTLNDVLVIGKVPYSKNFKRLAGDFKKYIQMDIIME